MGWRRLFQFDTLEASDMFRRMLEVGFASTWSSATTSETRADCGILDILHQRLSSVLSLSFMSPQNEMALFPFKAIVSTYVLDHTLSGKMLQRRGDCTMYYPNWDTSGNEIWSLGKSIGCCDNGCMWGLSQETGIWPSCQKGSLSFLCLQSDFWIGSFSFSR